MDKFNWFWDGVGPNFISAILLSAVNVINYIDRYTPSAVISSLKASFGFTEQWKSGFLQTTQFLALTVIPPIYGVLGDRFSRKILIVASLIFWSCSVLMSSFTTSYWSFLAFQTLVGFGEAGFTTIVPTVFPDLFRGRAVSIWLAVFYFAIPLGSGLGYIMARSVQDSLIGSLGNESWRWAIRFTCVPAGILAIILFICLKDPPRGTKTDEIKIIGKRKKMKNMAKTLLKDMQQIFSVKTYTLALFGMVSMYFMTGALAWWGPPYLKDACNYQNLTSPESFKASICGECDEESGEYYGNIDFYFGAILLVSGVLGILIGTFLSAYFRPKYPAVDPLIIGSGLFLAGFLLLGAFLLVSNSLVSSLILIFFGTTFASLNWAVVVDMTLYVIPPFLRSTATGLQTAIAHGFGDAASPYIVGAIADSLRRKPNVSNFANNNTITCFKHVDEAKDQFDSLQGALWTTTVMTFLSAITFMIVIRFVVADKTKAEAAATDAIGDNSITETTPDFIDNDVVPAQSNSATLIVNDHTKADAEATDARGDESITNLTPDLSKNDIMTAQSTSTSLAVANQTEAEAAATTANEDDSITVTTPDLTNNTQ